MPKGIYPRKNGNGKHKNRPSSAKGQKTTELQQSQKMPKPIQVMGCPSPEHFVSRLDLIFSSRGYSQYSEVQKAEFLHSLYQTLESFKESVADDRDDDAEDSEEEGS